MTNDITLSPEINITTELQHLARIAELETIPERMLPTLSSQLQQLMLPATLTQLNQCMYGLEGARWPSPMVIPNRDLYKDNLRLQMEEYPFVALKYGVPKAVIAANMRIENLDIPKYCDEAIAIVHKVIDKVERSRRRYQRERDQAKQQAEREAKELIEQQIMQDLREQAKTKMMQHFSEDGEKSLSVIERCKLFTLPQLIAILDTNPNHIGKFIKYLVAVYDVDIMDDQHERQIIRDAVSKIAVGYQLVYDPDQIQTDEINGLVARSQLRQRLRERQIMQTARLTKG